MVVVELVAGPYDGQRLSVPREDFRLRLPDTLPPEGAGTSYTADVLANSPSAFWALNADSPDDLTLQQRELEYLRFGYNRDGHTPRYVERQTLGRLQRGSLGLA